MKKMMTDEISIFYHLDMPGLNLEVLSGSQMLPIAVVCVEQIQSLAPNRPINGTYSAITTEHSEKVAEIKISIVMESLISKFSLF